MASKSMASAALFLCFNLFFFAVSSSYVPCPPPPSKGHKHHHHKTPPSTPTPVTPAAPSCPRDALKLGACADVLGLVTVVIGSPPKTPCCALLDGLANLEAAVCLCTAIKANVLGLNLNLPVSLSLILNYCGKGVPSGFQCA